jgi:formylglycine-generating enzyme required for sulfatase activity/class 3 adenylate cyclase
MRTPPTGIVTFLFTDIEGYTRGFEAAPEAMARAVARHDACVRGAVESAGGVIFKTIGDAFQIAFALPQQALAAAVAAQRALAAEDWSAIDGLPSGLRVRMAVDVIVAEPHDGDYRTPRLNRIARLMAAGHGGQVLLTGDAVVALADRIRAGVTLRPLGAHRLKDLREPVTAFHVVAPDTPDITTPLKTAGPLTTRDRIVVVDPHAGEGARVGGAARPSGALFADLLAVVRGQAETAQISLAEVRQLIGHRPADEAEYRLMRLAEWSQPRYQLDSRFVALSMWVDQGEQAAKDRWVAAPERYDDLGTLLRTVPDTALVVLGPPGSGKSTLLRRLELDLAIDGLRVGGDHTVRAPLSWFVPLNQYRADTDADPADWLADRWAARYPALPPMRDLIAAGRMILLLDGLNEMPHASSDEYRRLVRRWQRYVAEIARSAPGTRVVFSCRSLDYSAPLSTPDLRVPQVVVEPMSDGQIREFLDAYAPSLALELWTQLTERGQLSLVRSPFLARLLVEQALHEGTRATSQAALITGFVRQALRREIELGNGLLEPDALLTERDVNRITAGGWPGAYDLPERGALIGAVAGLAHAMQAGRTRPDGGQVRIDYDAALAAVAHPRAADIVHACIDLGWLDEDTGADEVLFSHQLLQEYFAARAFAAHPDVERLRTAWQAADAGAGLDDIVARLPAADPLPPLPTTGWEETAVMAAAMGDDPAAMVGAMMDVNLALAGRCAAQPDVLPRLGADVVDRMRRALADRSRDGAADLRARLAAGLALGPLGDPRFERRAGPHGAFLAPPVVSLPGGEHVLGDDAPIHFGEQVWSDHQPRHKVVLEPFAVGRFMVTNAEWACFVAAGGYDDECWWDTSVGRGWRRGEGTEAAAHANVRNWLAVIRANPGMPAEELARGRWSAEIHERWLRRLAMTAAEFEAHLEASFPGQRKTEPQFWRDARFNNPAQPVIGISWHEARAYCAWLRAQTGQPFRLLTEAEWEAAARGPAGRRFAYGDTLDRWRANTMETHLRQVAPIGLFPDGDTPEGLADMAGNVYTWTSTAWGADPETSAFPYPYAADDGREAADTAPDVQRIIRGGSWYDDHPTSLVYARNNAYASDRRRMSGVGVRLALG